MSKSEWTEKMEEEFSRRVSAFDGETARFSAHDMFDALTEIRRLRAHVEQAEAHAVRNAEQVDELRIRLAEEDGCRQKAVGELESMQTGFDKYLRGRMKDPEFADEYHLEREALARNEGARAMQVKCVKALEALLIHSGVSPWFVGRAQGEIFKLKPEDV